MQVLLFLCGFAALLKGAQWLVFSSTKIARRFGISDLVIGLTLVSIGTSFPELAINIFASLKQESDIILGNIIGSNISNTWLILGITGLISPLYFPKCKLKKELYYYVATLLLFLAVIFIISPGIITAFEGLLLLIASFSSLFLFFVPNAEDREMPVNGESLLSILVFFILGAILLPLGGHLVIQSSVSIASAMGLSKAFVSLFAIALGTSLPELVTSATAALKGNSHMALGNIVGSNIFNLSLIIGTSALIHHIQVSSLLSLDALIMAFSGLLLLLLILISKKEYLAKRYSVLFLVLYCAYIAYIYIR